MRISQAVERYAQAVFSLAIERKQTEAVYSDALLLQSLCQENRPFVMMLKSPVIREKKKQKILRELLEKRLGELMMRFLLILVRKGREPLIPEIASSLVALYKEYNHILTVRLTTAIEPTKAIQNRVEEILRDYTKWQIDLKKNTDPEIIGGFILKWRDRQYDASIRHQVERLRRGAARVNLYKKGF